MLVFIGLMLIVLSIIAHEAGHYLAAKRNGIVVEEFGIGFPPRAKKLFTRDGTDYTLNWLPIGGFVKLKGENDAASGKGSYGAARLIDKVKVMTAGVAVNFFIAYLLFTIISLVGMPQLIENQFNVKSDSKITQQEVLVGFIADDSPASRAKQVGGESSIDFNDSIKSISAAGCEVADKTVSSDCHIVVTNSDNLGEITGYFAGQEVLVEVLRDGETLYFETQFNTAEFVEEGRQKGEGTGYFGIITNDFEVRRSTWAAPIVGAGTTVQFTQVTLEGLWNILTGLFQGDTETAKQNVSGVVGVGFIFSEASFLGPIFMLMIVAVVSLSLAIMNLLPIPALDGGRLYTTLIFRAFKKPLTKEIEEKINGTGFILLMGLVVLITILDVQRFIL